MIEYCPKCQSGSVSFDHPKKYTCSNCGWVYFQNPAAAVMAVLTLDDKILFTTRAKEPAKGKLDFPGGFIDPGENAEEALSRELYEELRLNNLSFTYLGSSSNSYEYKGIVYPICDMIFTSAIESMPTWFQTSEISDIMLKNLNEIEHNELSFRSVKKAITLIKNTIISTPNL